HADVTVQGTWTWDPKSGRQCGASGNGTIDHNMPNGGAPQGCLLWSINPHPGQPKQPWHVPGWFTADSQNIDWGGTSPGDGVYTFQINDDRLDDNVGSLTLTGTLYP